MSEVDKVSVVLEKFSALIESMQEAGFDFSQCGPTVFSLELPKEQLDNVVEKIGEHPYFRPEFDLKKYTLDANKQGEPIKREYTFLQFKLLER